MPACARFLRAARASAWQATRATAVTPKPQRGAGGRLLSGDCGGPNRGDRQHDSQPDDDDRRNENPDGGEASEDAGLPESEAGAQDQNEVTDQVEVDEPHNHGSRASSAPASVTASA